MANLLTTHSAIGCPHGGQAIMTSANTLSFGGGAAVLLESDILPVAGCPFTVAGPKYSPCIRIEWSAGAAKTTIKGTALLTVSSVGKCINTEGATQGKALINNTQALASAS